MDYKLSKLNDTPAKGHNQGIMKNIKLHNIVNDSFSHWPDSLLPKLREVNVFTGMCRGGGRFRVSLVLGLLRERGG